MRVVYTDPPWAIDHSGRPDLALAHIERAVYGADIEVDLGLFGDGYQTSGPAFLAHIAGAEAVVIYRCQITKELTDAISGTCRVVVRSGVGIDNLNAPVLEQAGIPSFNVPDYCGDEVSSQALALLLALERRICVQDRLVRADRWSIHGGGIPRRQSTRMAGIVGFGRIGRASARKLQVFYRGVMSYDPYVSSDLMASHGVAAAASLAELFSACDAVLIHAALTQETDRLVNAQVLDHARPGLLLVNTARGRLVDIAAVAGALDEGRLGGFGSDVFSPEDPNECPIARRLLSSDDVVVSAHRAFLSAESELSLRRRVAEGVRSVLDGGSMPAIGQVT